MMLPLIRRKNFRLRIVKTTAYPAYNGDLTPVKPSAQSRGLSRQRCDAIILHPAIRWWIRFVIRALNFILLALTLLFFLASCSTHTVGQPDPSPQVVELLPIELDSRNPERKEFGRLEFLNGFELRSKDRRFGGLSGLTLGTDGRLYSVSDAGYWVSARMTVDSEAKLLDLADWLIQPILSATGAPVTDSLHDAEALARAPDGSFLVAFENVHRIWRYPPPPLKLLLFAYTGSH